MFSKAYPIANKYTLPFIITMRFFDKSVECGLGSYIVINSDGWMMTAAHNFGVVFGYNQHQKELEIYHQKVEMTNGNEALSETEKQAILKNIIPNPKWITHYAIHLNGRAISIFENYIYNDHDIAFFRIDNTELIAQTVFPKIKNSHHLQPGTSLCKLGFPFVNINAVFDESTAQFLLPSNALPIPLFPIEGIYTRNFLKGKSQDGTLDILFLETSSPGLKGQSGGPIFDTEGAIYAVQSQNITIPLGFTGKGLINGVGVEENQFLNMGIGVHPFTIETLLGKHGIRYERAD